MDLVDFINARLDEDEQAARAVVSSHEREPRLVPCVAAADWSHRYDSDDYGGTEVADGAGHVIVPMSYESGALQRIHIARHDPARVLAEVDAKRRIIAEHQASAEFMNRPENRHIPAGETHGLYTALKMLALPYDQHPDYQEQWRP
jgi:hypothetical protein